MKLFAKIDCAGNGNNTLVAAVAGKKIRVRSYVLMAGGTVNAKFQSGASGNDLTGAFPLTAQAGISAPEAGDGQFETDVGSLLNLNLSGAVQVSGHLRYSLL